MSKVLYMISAVPVILLVTVSVVGCTDGIHVSTMNKYTRSDVCTTCSASCRG